MKKSIISIICIVATLFAGCDGKKENSPTILKSEYLDADELNTTEQKSFVPENVDKDFELFIEIFNQNESFQLSRVQFPLKAELLDEDLINTVHTRILEKDFRLLSLSLMESSDYSVELIRDSEKVNIEYSGIENGIASSYTFKKIEGRWILVELIDVST